MALTHEEDFELQRLQLLRQIEAEKARQEAEKARQEAEKTQQEAKKVQQEAEKARQEAEKTQQLRLSKELRDTEHQQKGVWLMSSFTSWWLGLVEPSPSHTNPTKPSSPSQVTSLPESPSTSPKPFFSSSRTSSVPALVELRAPSTTEPKAQNDESCDRVQRLLPPEGLRKRNRNV